MARDRNTNTGERLLRAGVAVVLAGLAAAAVYAAVIGLVNLPRIGV